MSGKPSMFHGRTASDARFGVLGFSVPASQRSLANADIFFCTRLDHTFMTGVRGSGKHKNGKGKEGVRQRRCLLFNDKKTRLGYGKSHALLCWDRLLERLSLPCGASQTVRRSATIGNVFLVDDR